jgi:hypothetical protein
MGSGGQLAPKGGEKDKARLRAEERGRIREQRIENSKLGGVEIGRIADVGWRTAWKAYLRVILAEHPEKRPRWIALWVLRHKPAHLRSLKLRCILGYLEQIRKEHS